MGWRQRLSEVCLDCRGPAHSGTPKAGVDRGRSLRRGRLWQRMSIAAPIAEDSTCTYRSGAPRRHTNAPHVTAHRIESSPRRTSAGCPRWSLPRSPARSGAGKYPRLSRARLPSGANSRRTRRCHVCPGLEQQNQRGHVRVNRSHTRLRRSGRGDRHTGVRRE